MTFDDLPEDVQIAILQQLSTRDALAVGSVSKQFLKNVYKSIWLKAKAKSYADFEDKLLLLKDYPFLQHLILEGRISFSDAEEVKLLDHKNKSELLKELFSDEQIVKIERFQMVLKEFITSCQGILLIKKNLLSFEELIELNEFFSTTINMYKQRKILESIANKYALTALIDNLINIDLIIYYYKMDRVDAKVFFSHLFTKIGLKALEDKLIDPQLFANHIKENFKEICEILSPNGLMALREKLVTIDEMLSLPLPSINQSNNRLRYLFTDIGLRLLREKLILPKHISKLSDETMHLLKSKKGYCALSKKLINLDMLDAEQAKMAAQIANLRFGMIILRHNLLITAKQKDIRNLLPRINSQIWHFTLPYENETDREKIIRDALARLSNAEMSGSPYEKLIHLLLFSTKTFNLLDQVYYIDQDSQHAYEFIHTCFSDYSQAKWGGGTASAVGRFFTLHKSSHGYIVVNLLLKPEYKTFDQDNLVQFYKELKVAIGSKEINRDGDLFAIFMVAEYLTDICYDMNESRAVLKADEFMQMGSGRR